MVWHGMVWLDYCHRSDNLGAVAFDPNPENGEGVRA